jgi:transcriptional regulator with XRE-family HTH domain
MLDILSDMRDERAGLAGFVRSARDRKGLTLRAVEESTGVSNAYLSQLETGKIHRPSPVVLHKLSTLYEVPYGELMRLAGYPVPDEAGGSIELNHSASRIGPITAEEEQQLIEYLAFLRSRNRRGSRA